MFADHSYFDVLCGVLASPIRAETRNGAVRVLPGATFRHQTTQTAEGLEHFPILQHRKIGFKTALAELLWFLSGSTDESELAAMGCHLWAPWRGKLQAARKADGWYCPDGLDSELGAIYGAQWRLFTTSHSYYIDQIADLERRLKIEPQARHHVVSAWDPRTAHDRTMAVLPPCHFAFQAFSDSDNRLHLIWYQRSVDVACGLPYNIASYGLLQAMLCASHGFSPGVLVGQLGHVHAYESHLAQLEALVDADDIWREDQRQPTPTLVIDPQPSVLAYRMEHFRLENYAPRSAVRFEVVP